MDAAHCREARAVPSLQIAAMGHAQDQAGEVTYTPDFYEIAEIDNESFWAKKLGKKGGSVKSEKKAATSRENGKKGGRPKTK